MAGSLTIECIKIGHNINIDTIQCNPGIAAPQCNGSPEGCTSNEWLGGFQAFVVENSTNAILLDPICCSSPTIKVDSLSCASERLNNVREPFEHQIVADDLIYRGTQCWHQYDMNNTLVDLVWKMEICQYTVNTPIPQRTFNLEHCPPCECHCGIDICGDHKEPIRIIHKQISKKRCACDCLCHYECI
uniref:Uncharacterized protein n=1 Tax=Panagrolaimus sp. PS1159 TaxID=55785 RepID=A0AC35F7U4_9BILA